MPRGKRKWDVPLGFVGLGAMAIVGGAAFTLGEFDFYGIEFLAHWHRIGGWFAGLSVFAAAFGTIGECVVWNGRMGRGLRLLSSWHSAYAAYLAATILVALAIVYWSAHQQYQCLLLRAPILGLPVFALATSLQKPIVLTLRNSGRNGAAFAALLVLEAGMMLLIGELLAVDDYRKGLEHFQKETRADWSISAFGSSDFYIDFARNEVVLKAHAGAGTPLEIRRSFADFVCK